MKKLFLASVVSLFLAAGAHGEFITDPSILHIGNPPNAGTYLFGDEVLPISNTYLAILENGGGQPLLDNPLRLILGIPDSTTLPSPIDYTSPASTVTGPTYMTNLDPGEEVYGILGLGDKSNDSNSFTNWAAAELAVNGITAGYFGLFVYELSGTGIEGGSTVGVHFDSPLPLGTFAVAYGTYSTARGITPFSTPFTESGLTTEGPPVPEPATLVLMGAGLAGLVLYRRKMR